MIGTVVLVGITERLRASANTPPWLYDLRAKLMNQIDVEMEMTVQIAVCLAAKMPKRQIIETLGCSEVDIKLAMQRLENVVGTWTSD